MRLASAVCIGLCLALALVPHANALLPIPPASCEGVAPETTRCSTGTHVLGPIPGLDVSAGDGYTGTIVNRLVSESREMGHMCNYEAGVTTGCLTWGHETSPEPGVFVTHECASYADTRATVPGGSGSFGCTVSGTLQVPE